MPTDFPRTTTLIPEEIVREIITGAVQRSVVLSLARRLNLRAGVTNVPVLAVLPTAFWVGETGDRKQVTAAEWAKLQLKPAELAALIPVPENDLADSAFDVWGELRAPLEEAAGRLIDLAVLFGEQSPLSIGAGGIAGAARAAGNVGEGVDLAATSSDALGKVEEDGFDPTGFAARVGVRGLLRNLRATDGHFLYTQSMSSGGGAQSLLWDLPIEFSRNGGWPAASAAPAAAPPAPSDGEVSPVPDMIAGDWTKLIVGIRQDITIRTFDQATITDGNGQVLLSAVESDFVVLRMVMRLDAVVANPATAGGPDESTRYPFALVDPAAGGGEGGGGGNGGNGT